MIAEDIASAQPIDWESLDFRHKYLVTWRAYYMDAARSGLGIDCTHPLVHGDAFPEFLQTLAIE